MTTAERYHRKLTLKPGCFLCNNFVMTKTVNLNDSVISCVL